LFSQVIMMDEISQLSGHLQRLLMSCAEHDITTDILVSPADPVAYRTALEGVRDCCNRIGASGITRGELHPLFVKHGGDYSPAPEGLIDPRDIIIVTGTPFTPVQKRLIYASCLEWATPTVPDDPDAMAALIESAIHPLTLADILSPEATGMLRFPAIMQLQTAGRAYDDLVRPLCDPGTRILVLATDEPAVFCGYLNREIFRFISGKGIIPDLSFPETVLQALYDIGVLREGGEKVLADTFRDEGHEVMDLFKAGQALSVDRETISDIRTIFGLTLLNGTDSCLHDDTAPMPGEDLSGSYTRLRQLSGHVLAGFISTRAEMTKRPCTDLVLEFVGSVAARPSGRAPPGTGQIRDLERNIQDAEQLIRAVTRDYAWRAIPMPLRTAGYRPVVDLWPDRHLILYDQEELVYRSPEASKALIMEALYRHSYGLRSSDSDSIQETGDWYHRLVSVVTTPRAVLAGARVHPGVARWMKTLCTEEYDPVNRMVTSSLRTGWPLPDQFLDAAVCEGRTDKPARDIQDPLVKCALDVTYELRNMLSRSETTSQECLAMIREQIWPVFRQLSNDTPAAIPANSVSPGRSHRGAPQNAIRPQGTAPRIDTTVPDAHHPETVHRGKVVEGKGKSLLDNDGLLVPGGHRGAGVKAKGQDALQKGREAIPAGPGSGTESCPFPGMANSHPGITNQGRDIPDAISGMMDACGKSAELLEKLSSQDRVGDTGGARTRDRRKTLSDLQNLAKKIDEMARLLGEQVRNGQGSNGQAQPANAHDQKGERGQISDTLLKTSQSVRKAAREYRDALGKVERKVESSGGDPGSIQHLTGMTMKAFRDLQQAGTEFQRLSGGSAQTGPGSERPIVRLPDADNDPDTGGEASLPRTGRLEPSFAANTGYTPGVWESLAYFDASFDDGLQADPKDPSSDRHSRDTSERRFEQNTQALTREAEIYLGTLRQRTRSDWETIDEKAERIRKVALFESQNVGQDDYATYQRFYQPVAGLTGVARKNIQQALQKTRATRDLNELTTGDDIDEENLAAVRTTMRIFRDRGREPDKTRWCISLLIDASSSMHDETVARKLQATIQTAILFGEALNRITGIRFEIAAFSDTEYIPLKRYIDDWNIHQGCYLIRQVVQATGGTNDVGAVISALDRMNRLHMSAGANRMIFVISDGQSGVGGREQMRTIRSTNKNTRIFGWGIGPDMEKVEETYRPYGTWVPDIADLPRSMGEVLRRELGRPAMAGWNDDPADTMTDQDTASAGDGPCTN